MRNAFILLMAAVMTLTTVAFCQSCKDTTLAKVEYNVDIVGDADGVINITFPDGLLVFNGDAGVDFHYGNAEANARLLTIDDALQSYDPKIIQAAELASREFREAFDVTAASGTYDFTINGFVVVAGIKIKVEGHYSNRENR